MSQTNHHVVLPLFSEAVQEGPKKKYRTIVADPPWSYKERGRSGPKGPEGAYSTMPIEQINSLPVGLWADDDSALFLWTTHAFMEAAHKVARSWGFNPRWLLTWIKGRIEYNKLIQHIGLGEPFRTSTEYVLVGERGSPTWKRRDIPTAFIAPRGEHSEKPAAFYDIAESVAFGPYLDVFARKMRFNWDCWGDEMYVLDGLPEVGIKP